jgi:phosphoribosyl 1,2-cyclic phosphodiesterase
MRVRFWGVRGSVPWAGNGSTAIGSNTPCLHLQDEASGASLILDAGTGLVGVGERTASPAGSFTILLSHYHWDHVQGLPFFAPLFRPGSRVVVAGPPLLTVGPGWLSTLFDAPHFPVPISDLGSAPEATFVEPGTFRVGGFEVRALRLHHPGGSFAYRIAGSSGDLVYATDHEFGDRRTDETLAAFASGAAAVVMDAHYTPEELPSAIGRGHGSWRQCVDLAASAGVGHLWLFHHKPGRTDDEIMAIEQAARRLMPAASAAREGLDFTL